MPDTLSIGQSVQLTPEQLAQVSTPAPPVDESHYTSVPSVPQVGDKVQLSPAQQTDARKQTGQLDPILDFTPEQLVSLQQQTPGYSFLDRYASRPELHSDPTVHQKIADAYSMIRQAKTAPTTIVEKAKSAGTGLFELAKGVAKQIGGYAQAAATPVGAAIVDVAGRPDLSEEMLKQAQRQVVENIAGSETGIAQTGKLFSDVAGWVGRKTGLSKPLAEYTPAERVSALDDELAAKRLFSKTVQAKGPITATTLPGLPEEMAKQGVPIRPEEVQTAAAGDPFTWYAMGTAFKGAGAMVPKAVSARAAQALGRAGDLAATVGGKTIETAGDVTSLGSQAAKFVAPVVKPVAAVAGAIKGLASHGPIGAFAGLALGEKAGSLAVSAAEKTGAAGKFLTSVGEQISGAKPVVSPVAQLGKDILQTAPTAAGELAKGVGFDAALMAGTSENAPEERAGIGIGTAFGALGAGGKMLGRAVSGQIVAPRDYGVSREIPSSGQFPALDQMHNAAVADAPPGVGTRLNAVRLFARGAAPGTDVFLAKDQPSLQQALISSGVSPDQAALFSKQSGFFTTDLPGRDGQPRRVIVARDVESTPHESFHAIQDVLGESANREIDKIVQQAYAPQWEAEGNDYARRLVGAAKVGGDWRTAVLDASGWGKMAAADKLAMEASNEIRNQTGAEPKPSDVEALASAKYDQFVADAAKRNAGIPVDQIQNRLWRDILTPEEAKQAGDRYLSRELAAENFDAVFKHGLGGDKGVIQKLARIVANTTSVLGGNPIGDRTSEIGKLPLNYEVAKRVGESTGNRPIVSANRPMITPVAGPTAPPGGMPSTPEARSDAATEARRLADAAPDVAPAPASPALPTPQSPREVLGTMAEAIASRKGVKLNYHSAPDEPAAATTSSRPVRRAIIEAFRTMPKAARALWEKSFFPERVLQLKDGRYQVLGWAPEVFASNAHKMAQTLVDLPKVASPYPLDVTNRTFTEQGWKDLYADAQKFIENQGAGATGSGQPLVVPKDTLSQGFTAPAVEKGGAVPLDQGKADFINLLFNFKLPETPRITGGKTPLNIAGQDISAATMPGRVSIPVNPKAPYVGAAAENIGIAGRDILEVNPARRVIEQAAKDAGVKMPSMIEAIQRLNAENINEAQIAPELPEFRGNTLTLSAGFQPEAPVAAMERLKSMTTDDFAALKSYRGKYGGGITGWAFDVGAQAKTPADVQAMKAANEILGTLGREAMKRGDYDVASNILTKAQAAREAFEVATGKQITGESSAGSAEQMKRVDPNYVPPVLDKPEIAGQAAPMRNEEVEKIAADHAKAMGFKYNPARGTEDVPVQIAKDIADFYDAASHSPQDRNVRDSYRSFIKETVDQFKAIQDAGYKIEPFKGDGEPYKNSTEMTADVRDNKHLFFKPTGSDIKGDNLMLSDSGVRLGKQAFSANDIFRAVHDFFGHAKDGNTFGPKGEYNAWRAHSPMYSDAAQGAMAAETLGQNSWVNYGAHLRNQAGEIPAKGQPGYVDLPNRPFATQKNIVLPPDLVSGKVSGEDVRRTRSFIQNLGKETAQFQPADERKSRTGLEFKQFFTDVTAGRFGKSNVPFKPEQDMSHLQHIVDERAKHVGNFEDHIHKSIPTLYEEKSRSINGVLNSYPKGARLLDIAGSEGDYGKTISALSGGKIKTVTLDPNPEMAKAFAEKSKVPGATYAEESFGFPFEDAGRTYAQHTPAEKYDVINEAAGFQFIDPDRAGQVAEVKNLLKPDGLFLTVEKLKNPNWSANEKFKDTNFKNKYFTPEDLSAKDKRVGFSQSKDEQKSVGMVDNMVDSTELEKVLTDNFKHVTQYWDSGNFKGYAASDSPEVVQKFVDAAGDMNSKFSTVETPREITGQAAPKKVTADEWKLRPANNGFSKAWILPNGKPVQIGGQWHHDWIAEHPEIQKEYGIKQKVGGDDTSRAAALKKGFLRLNYDARTGALTFEARQKDFDNLRPAFEKFVQTNLPQIDKVQGYLFNDKVDQIADSGFANLFQLPKDQRLDAVPFLRAPGDITETSPQATPGALSETPSKNRGTQFQPQREQQFEGLGVGPAPLSTQQIASMTKAEVAAHYPEAVIPKRAGELIQSDIVGSPLYKAAGSEEAAVKAFAKKLVEFANENKDKPEYKLGERWYKDFVPQLKKEFGNDAQIFAELLAATSPNTGVTTNFGYAYDALQGLRSGRFRKLIPKFEEGLNKIADDSWETWLRREVKAGNAEGDTPAAFLARWIDKYDLKPRQSNGSLYGQHSVPVLQVFARQWMDRNTGPKTRNFVSNLLGTGHDATIDVWADRTMRRLGYQDFADRWRILPQNSTGVSDRDFHFSQKAFRTAADQLGINADDLQGAMWFAEKQHWADQGWGRLDLGSFQKEMEKIPLLESGIKQRLATTKAKSTAAPLTSGELGLTVEPRKVK